MATYTSFSELKDEQLEYGDTVQFTINGEELDYFVDHCCLVDTKHTSNALIFEKLGISDKNAYASHKYRYSIQWGKGDTSWPEYQSDDYSAATKLVCDLFQKCEIELAQYKKGEEVIVKDCYDFECHEYDYPFTFTNEMLRAFGGKKVTIAKVTISTECSKRKCYTEGYKYEIIEDKGKYAWSAAMFLGKAKEFKKTKDHAFSFTKKDIPKHCHYHPYVIDQALIEFSKGINPRITSMRDAFEICINEPVSEWFTWKDTTQDYAYWQNIFNNPSFVPSYYIPTYFIEELPIDVEELVEYCKKDISNAIAYCSSKTSCNSIEIPCSYEEVKLSIKKKKVHF